jgi:hypothetical protein
MRLMLPISACSGLLIAVALALLLLPLPTIAQAQVCQWYAGNDVNTIYSRPDAACRGYIEKNGWNPPGYIYHSTQYWSPGCPGCGARCMHRYRPAEFPSNQPTNIYNAGVKTAPCFDWGLCALAHENATSGCGRTFAELSAVTKEQDDPTRIFHQTQTCIAQRACDSRCKMNNCKWMRQVIPAFVGPYLLKTGDWQVVEQACRARGMGWWSDRRCAEAMARNHIFDDLLPALTQSGCGETTDWSQVYEAIEQCTGATLQNRLEHTASSSVVWL